MTTSRSIFVAANGIILFFYSVVYIYIYAMSSLFSLFINSMIGETWSFTNGVLAPKQLSGNKRGPLRYFFLIQSLQGE